MRALSVQRTFIIYSLSSYLNGSPRPQDCRDLLNPVLQVSTRGFNMAQKYAGDGAARLF
jgi:hypothetical protein